MPAITTYNETDPSNAAVWKNQYGGGTGDWILFRRGMHALHRLGARSARVVIATQIVEFHPTISVNRMADPK